MQNFVGPKQYVCVCAVCYVCKCPNNGTLVYYYYYFSVNKEVEDLKYTYHSSKQI